MKLGQGLALAAFTVAGSAGAQFQVQPIAPINVMPVDPHRPATPEEALKAKRDEERTAQPLNEGEGVKLPDQQFELPPEPAAAKTSPGPKAHHKPKRE